MAEKNDKKLKNLKELIANHKKVAVAFSGGVDSTFLLKICADVLGTENVIAITALSPTYNNIEKKNAVQIVQSWGIKHILIETDEMTNKEFTANPPDRCYHCKKLLFTKIIKYTKKHAIATIFDGSNFDDLNDYRPGRKALFELGISSPLMQAGLGKAEIRYFSKKLKLITWNRPASPCLASRIPYGNSITAQKLTQIAKAESFLKNLGFPLIRLRHHEKLARIEVPVQDLKKLMHSKTRQKVFNYLKTLGYIWICVDINGFRSGSLNEALCYRKQPTGNKKHLNKSNSNRSTRCRSGF